MPRSSSGYAQSAHARRLTAFSEGQDGLHRESKHITHQDGIQVNDTFWTAPALLKLTDSVRAFLVEHKSMGPREGELLAILNALLGMEAHGAAEQLIDIDAVRDARLDKLIEDLVDPYNQPAPPVPVNLVAARTAASSLQRQWTRRFREMWWLNIVCAHRDGIVGTTAPIPTKGQYGITVLPLLSGRERRLRNGHSVYQRESFQASDMHFTLMTQVGQQIRILRGCQLRSALAPVAGLRYDGLYKIVQYGQKLDEDTEIYRLALVLERVPEQMPLEELRSIPKPSQLDDWKVYESFEADRLKSSRGHMNFLAWKNRKMRDKLEHEQWLVSVGLKIGYQHFQTPSTDEKFKQGQTMRQGRRTALSLSAFRVRSVESIMAKKTNDKKPADKKGQGGKDAGAKEEKKVKAAQQINVRHILCEKHSKKEEALQKIRDGAKFDDVAREYSEDKGRQGGALGWKAKGTLKAEFEAVAYALEPSTTSNPKIGEAKTGFGYHIIMVEGRK
ncbi:uncharacterized protein PpBr36_06073 [Pyricularia pennisetigena]|uniref:uncharacterized protein n=1 Tax=Pyricularia pennisetigena TaxID=1578925 RepID=UPI001151D595|nr:uncharacterized protein PpBr36_06073 [Pyricularia pennisetigena]TLS23041.1 hypothetical protein PpBr36_06073 [Pyricularia pennisetigena]